MLEIIATQSQKNKDAFNPKNPRFIAAKKAVSVDGYYNLSKEFTQNQDAILLTQLIALTALSMVGGITMPVIKQVSIQKNTIKINWGNQVIDTFRFGQHDDHYAQFCRTIQQKITGDINAPKSFHKPFIKDCKRMIAHYKETSSKIEATLQKLIVPKAELKQLFSKEIDPSLLFILLSSLPDNEINAFLLYIQSYLPDDLQLTPPDGPKINVTTLFQSPSSDIQYLITKIQIYLSLYHSPQLPIIRHITQSKSQVYLDKMLDNQNTLITLTSTLTSLRDNQVKSRLNIYTLYELLISKLDL